MIIVIEGTDGSGKQTQTQMLFEYLKNNGKQVKQQSFPNYESDSSILVKKYLNGEFGGIYGLLPKQISIFYAVDRLLTMQQYKEYLSNGGVLLLDRYVTSNMLHQATKIDDDFERTQMIDWIEKFEYEDLLLPKPDVVIFLDMPPQFSKKLRELRGDLKAGTNKDVHEQDANYLKRCYNLGIQIAKDKNWNIIKCYEEDTIKSREQINKEIINLLSKI